MTVKKKKWYHVVRDARLIFLNRDKFAYLYGANGEKPETYEEAAKLVNAMWGAYPSHFKSSVTSKGHTKEELIQHIVGKRCYDCSSFVCAVTQCEGNYDELVVKTDYNTAMLRDKFSKVTTTAEGNWGAIVWKSGHVGVDVGNGLVVDFGNEFYDCREYRMSDPDSTKFTLSGELPWVDYAKAINF